MRCFPEPSMVAYRRPKNLGEILIRAKISSKRKSTRLKNGYRPCNGCIMCCLSKTTTTHKCNRSRKQWSINAPIDCQTSNVIYKLTCKKCPKFLYIGETKRCLSKRIQDHRGYIKKKHLNQVTGEHFNLPGHSVADLEVTGIERILPRGNDMIRNFR